MKKLVSMIIIIATLFSICAVSVSAASYSTGNYVVNTSSGVNVRSGAGTGYSKVGAASNGTTFTVSKISGCWGYTSSIKCTNATKSGWVSLDYCYKKSSSSSNSTRSTYNDVIASVKGSGYSLSQARSSESTSFTKNTFVYIWGFIHDINYNLYKTYGSGKCNMTLSVYRPNGSCAYTYTYNNCDCNWIGVRLTESGTWKIQSKITGSLVGTNTRTITVKNSASTVNPTSVSFNTGSITINKGSSKTISATVYPTNATNKSVLWTTSDSNVATVSNGTITGKGPGTATITAKTINGKTATCKVYVKGIVIQGIDAINVHVGDVCYLSTKSYGVSSSRKWSSSNTGILTVNSSGKVTAKKAGTVTVTVKTSDGYSASYYITVQSKNCWKTGNFDNGYVAKGYTTVNLNKNTGNAYIKIYSYDMLGKKSSGKMHITLRSNTGAWIWEGDISSGDKMKLGNDHSQYRIYIAKKTYPNTIKGNGDDFLNVGKCVYWAIECTDNCFV